jgi:hypothetical protein
MFQIPQISSDFVDYFIAKTIYNGVGVIKNKNIVSQ